MNSLTWSAPEYEERERSTDWFWALGVIAITGAITAIIFENYFFAVLILIGGGLLWLFAGRTPEWITYELGERGFKIGSHLYPFENIKSFWVQREGKPTLFVKAERFFMPIISVPIEPEYSDQIEKIFLDHEILEEEMKEHPSEKIMDTLGF